MDKVAKVEGKVPCIALGNDRLDNYEQNKGEITGLHFQKVDTGIVRPVLESNLFSAVDWVNAPNRNVQHHQPNLPFEQFVIPNRKWHLFADFMSNLKRVLITQMTPAGALPPISLYKGFASNVWNGGNDNKRTSMSTDRLLANIRHLLGQQWDDCPEKELYHEWMECLVMGFCNGGAPEVKFLLKYLLDINIYDKKGIVIAPAKTSKNQDIRSGVPHCLVYGYHVDQIDSLEEQRQQQRGRSRERHRSRRLEEREEQINRIPQRVLIPKQLGLTARSRSRSPSPLNDLCDDVENLRNNNHVPALNEILTNPNHYQLKAYRHHSYFEPHNPDLLLFETTNDDVTIAKVVVEICSYKKFPQTRLAEYMRKNTEQSVQQCLSAISHGQNEITGIVVVPDGIKMVKVCKQNRANRGNEFVVKEFEFVNWDNSNQLYALLDDLQNTMA